MWIDTMNMALNRTFLSRFVTTTSPMTSQACNGLSSGELTYSRVIRITLLWGRDYWNELLKVMVNRFV